MFRLWYFYFVLINVGLPFFLAVGFSTSFFSGKKAIYRVTWGAVIYLVLLCAPSILGNYSIFGRQSPYWVFIWGCIYVCLSLSVAMILSYLKEDGGLSKKIFWIIILLVLFTGLFVSIPANLGMLDKTYSTFKDYVYRNLILHKQKHVTHH